jgi:hypothetical protein
MEDNEVLYASCGRKVVAETKEEACRAISGFLKSPEEQGECDRVLRVDLMVGKYAGQQSEDMAKAIASALAFLGRHYYLTGVRIKCSKTGMKGYEFLLGDTDNWGGWY